MHLRKEASRWSQTTQPSCRLAQQDPLGRASTQNSSVFLYTLRKVLGLRLDEATHCGITCSGKSCHISLAKTERHTDQLRKRFVLSQHGYP